MRRNLKFRRNAEERVFFSQLNRKCTGVARSGLMPWEDAWPRLTHLLSDEADCPTPASPSHRNCAERVMCLQFLGCHLGVTVIQASQRSQSVSPPRVEWP